jgi:hypothetical protein
MGPNADVVNVLSRYLRFYSIIDQKPQNHEVDIGDLAISKYNKVFFWIGFLKFTNLNSKRTGIVQKTVNFGLSMLYNTVLEYFCFW